MAKGIIIPADPEQEVRVQEFNDLDDYQQAVDGPIESVDMGIPALNLFVNEEGKLRGLPMNPRATATWWAHNRAVYNVDIIVGDAVIIGPADEDGETMDVPEGFVEMLHMKSYFVEIRKPGDPEWYTNGETYDNFFTAAIVAAEMWQKRDEATAVQIAGTNYDIIPLEAS